MFSQGFLSGCCPCSSAGDKCPNIRSLPRLLNTEAIFKTQEEPNLFQVKMDFYYAIFHVQVKIKNSAICHIHFWEYNTCQHCQVVNRIGLLPNEVANLRESKRNTAFCTIKLTFSMTKCFILKSISLQNKKIGFHQFINFSYDSIEYSFPYYFKSNTEILTWHTRWNIY